MFTRTFWLGEGGAIVKAIRTFAQTAIAMIGVGTTTLFELDLKAVAGTAGLAALLSLLMSLDRTTEGARVTITETAAPITPPPVFPAPAGHGYTGEDLR